jgi:hypothetical protein
VVGAAEEAAVVADLVAAMAGDLVGLAGEVPVAEALPVVGRP